MRRIALMIAVLSAVVLTKSFGDTTVGDFEALPHDQRAQRLSHLTNATLEKIAAKNPQLALKIQEYFITPSPHEKVGAGAVALEKQILEYDRIDPTRYTIENALAKVLGDYLSQNPATTRPATQPTTVATTQSS